MKTSTCTIYRPSRVLCVFHIGWAMLFGLFGPFAIIQNDMGCCWFGIIVPVALLVLYAGVAGPSNRIQVNDQNLSKTYWLGTIFRIAWVDIESWAVKLSPGIHDSPDRSLIFRLHGKGNSITVTEFEVSAPGFDQFVNDVRKIAGAREEKIDTVPT